MQLNALCKNGPALTIDKPGKRLLTHITGIKITRQTLLCMKITAFILFAFCMHVGAATLAQNVTLSEHKAPLEKVINEIKRQTGYSFFYNQDWLQQAQPVDVQVKNASLETTLKTCFSNQPFDYAIVNKTIVLKIKEKPVFDPQKVMVALNVTGVVTDSVGTPLIGATISIKGSTVATITNEKGEFSINAQINDWIVVSFVGFKPFEFRVSESQNFIPIHLSPLNSGLKEVVISTGYQSLPAERATGSFAKVDNELFNRRVSGNAIDRLEGIVPGLLFNRNQSGSPVTIRGYSTIFSNTDPLIVVDNFPFDGDISNINPNDIENITVLKDAAAASIWGVRSGNGVIVITTKKGQRNHKLSVEANANVTVGDRPNVFYNPNFLDSKNYIDVEKSLFSQGFYDGKLSDPSHTFVSPIVQILADQRSGKLTLQQANAQIGNLQGNDIRNDIEKYLYRKSISQQYALNLKGGGASNDYFFSVGYDHNLLNAVGDKNSRITLTSEQNFYPVKNLTFNIGLNYYQTKMQTNDQFRNLNNTGTILFPYESLADKSGNAVPIVKDHNYAWITDPVAQKDLLNWQYFPLNEINAADNTENILENRIHAGLSYSITRGLTFDLKYQHELQKESAENYYSPDTYYARNLINSFTNLAAQNTHPIPVGGISNQGETELNSNRYRVQLNYSSDIHPKATLNAIIGSEVNSTVVRTNSYNTIYGYDKTTGAYQNVDFTSYFVQFPSLNSQQIPNNESFYKSTDHYVSYFGNAAYSFDQRYLISLSGRIDKSNLFGVSTNQKAVPLYSIGVAWNLNKEKFYNWSVLPISRFRVTYGYNGNLNKSATAVTTLFTQSNSNLFGNNFNQIANPGNPSLRWEKDQMINFGWDFGFKNNVVSGSVEYYLKKGVDLFGNSPLPPSTGVPQFYGNTASIKGHGLDIQLNINAVKRNRFNWSTILILSHATDLISKYDLQVRDAQSNLAGGINPIVGRPIYSIYSYKWGGLTHNSGMPQGYLNGKLSTDYSAIISRASVDSLVFHGSATPTIFGSFRNNFSYGPITLSVNIIYKLKYFFRRQSIAYTALFYGGQGHVDFLKRWQNPGDEEHTIVPSMPALNQLDVNSSAFYANSSALVDRGDHIRLQDITLSYTLRKLKWFNGISNIQFYAYVNNVGILWRANHDHLDPDLYSTSLPLPRTIALGLKTNF